MKGVFLLHLALSLSTCMITMHDAVAKMVLVEDHNLGLTLTLLVSCVMMLKIMVVLVLNLVI